MFRTDSSVEVLKPIALIAGLAILLWSLGLPSLSFVQAANVSNFSDTLSDSSPGASSNHDIQFVSTTGVSNGQSIQLDFETGFDLAGIGEEDIDLLVDSSNVTNANWSISTTTTQLIITLDTGDIASGSSTQILIGLNATNEGSPDSQITNPSPAGGNGDYFIDLTADEDTGQTRVVIIDNVTVSASVDTVFTFTVSGVSAGGTVNGESITGNTTSTTIQFGTLTGGNASTSAQLLTVQTNAANGYVVTVQSDGYLRSSTGADIDDFVDGSATNSPTAWAPPSGLIADDNTWGHWGVTTDDYDTDARSVEFSGTDQWIGVTTTPRAIMGHDGPALATSGAGIGTTTVGYKIEITDLQEAGDDYETVLTYVATPTF